MQDEEGAAPGPGDRTDGARRDGGAPPRDRRGQDEDRLEGRDGDWEVTGLESDLKEMMVLLQSFNAINYLFENRRLLITLEKINR